MKEVVIKSTDDRKECNHYFPRESNIKLRKKKSNTPLLTFARSGFFQDAK